MQEKKIKNSSRHLDLGKWKQRHLQEHLKVFVTKTWTKSVLAKYGICCRSFERWEFKRGLVVQCVNVTKLAEQCTSPRKNNQSVLKTSIVSPPPPFFLPLYSSNMDSHVTMTTPKQRGKVWLISLIITISLVFKKNVIENIFKQIAFDSFTFDRSHINRIAIYGFEMDLLLVGKENYPKYNKYIFERNNRNSNQHLLTWKSLLFFISWNMKELFIPLIFLNYFLTYDWKSGSL